MEEFNEVCTILIIYSLICMSKMVSSINTKYMVGFYFIFVIILNLGTHLYFLIRDLFISMKNKLRKRNSKKVLERNIINARKGSKMR